MGLPLKHHYFEKFRSKNHLEILHNETDLHSIENEMHNNKYLALNQNLMLKHIRHHFLLVYYKMLATTTNLPHLGQYLLNYIQSKLLSKHLHLPPQ